MVKLYYLIIYAWKYLKLSIHSGIIWGSEKTVEDNDKQLSSMYPKEWKELEDIREKVK